MFKILLKWGTASAALISQAVEILKEKESPLAPMKSMTFRLSLNIFKPILESKRLYSGVDQWEQSVQSNFKK